jgi:Kdo2-lipid IVA lauroyltransferase/acyltransferase
MAGRLAALDGNRAIQTLEYRAVQASYGVCRLAPESVVHGATALLADFAFTVLSGRRRLALRNLRHALGTELGAGEIRRIARHSFRSFLLTAMPEPARIRPHLTGNGARAWLRQRSPELEGLFARVKQLHEETRGCIFVTPHLGNWELLPGVAAAVGVPLAVVVRPLDNSYLEAWLARSRRSSGQVFVTKRNAFLTLQYHLTRGTSLGLLPDQATFRGLALPFFGRPAMTTPVPALLAVQQGRPIVVVACFRIGRLRFSGYLGEPIWPGPHESEKAEVIRLTSAMNRAMEDVIRAHPEQYLWMHNRWKTFA